MPWARCLVDVPAGTIDGIFSVNLTRERQEFLTYAEEALITQVRAFFVRKDSAITFNGDPMRNAQSNGSRDLTLT